MPTLPRLITDGLTLIQQGRISELSRRVWRRINYLLPPRLPKLEPITELAAWQSQNTWTETARVDLLDRLSAIIEDRPRILVVIDATGQSATMLTQTIQSLQSQVYTHWEFLCVAGNALTHGRNASDSRVPTNAILPSSAAPGDSAQDLVAAVNQAINEIQSDILMLVGAGDVLSPAALGEFALEFASNPDIDYAYCDDEIVDLSGARKLVRFKSPWVPERILWPCMFREMIAVSSHLFHAAGGFSFDDQNTLFTEFKCRAIALARGRTAIPMVLHHLRGSRIGSSAPVPSCCTQVVTALLDNTASRFSLEVQPDGAARIRAAPSAERRVAVVLWGSQDQREFAEACRALATVRLPTIDVYAYAPSFQTIPNDSEGPRLSIVSEPNIAGALDAVARNSSAEFLLLLHANLRLAGCDWINDLVGALALPDAGVAGLYKLNAQAQIEAPRQDNGYAGLNSNGTPLEQWRDDRGSGVTPCLAVSGYCLLTRRTTWLELGGIDSNLESVWLAAADYCARVNSAGFRVLHVPVGGTCPPEESTPMDPRSILRFRVSHRDLSDPWLNPNLADSNGSTSLLPRRIVRRSPKAFRAVFFSHSLSLDGAPFSQYELAVELKRRGVLHPEVASPVDGPLAELYARDGIPVRVDPALRPRIWSANTYEHAVTSAHTLIRTIGAALVHANTLMTFPAVEGAYRAGRPSIWNPRESERWDQFFRFLDRGQITRPLACFPYPYRVVFVAQATLDVWSRFNTHHNFTLIRNGLNPARFAESEMVRSKQAARDSLGVQDGEVMVLAVGTVCERKGQRDIPRALRKLPTGIAQRTRVYIVGDESNAYSSALRKDIQRLPRVWDSRICLMKTTRDVGPLYQAADVFLLSSREESYPRVVLEAMNFGLPIIATPVFGVREQVVQDINGSFYRPGDTEALAQQLQAMIENPEGRKSLAEGSTLMLGSLPTFEEMVNQYTTVFREALYTK